MWRAGTAHGALALGLLCGCAAVALLVLVLREPPPLNLPVARSAATHVQRLRHRAGYHFVHCTSMNFPARVSSSCPCTPRGQFN